MASFQLRSEHKTDKRTGWRRPAMFPHAVADAAKVLVGLFGFATHKGSSAASALARVVLKHHFVSEPNSKSA